MDRLIFAAVSFFFLLSPSLALTSPTDLRAGVASMITPVSTVRYYQQIIDYLGEKLGVPAEMVHRTTYDEIDLMLEQGQVDVAFICSLSYVLDNEKFGGELLVVPQVAGKTVYQSVIIVHRDSNIEYFDDLENRSFVFVDPKSNSGRLYPLYLLAKRHFFPEQFFDSFLYSYSHNKSVEMVAKKRADGASVDSIVYDYMLATGSPYAEQTTIIHRSPPFGIPPVVVPPSTSPELKQAMRSILVNMHQDQKGKKILEQMRIERFVTTDDSSYDSIRAMLAFIRNSQDHPIDQDAAPVNRPRNDQAMLFSVLPRDNPIIAYERYQPLIDYLSRETGKRFELHLEKSYEDVVDRLGDGTISFALLGPLTYLDAHRRFGTAPIARSQNARGETFFRSVIVTGPDGSIAEVADLVDKRFAFAALWSTSGTLIPRYLLAWAGILLNQLESYHHYNYHDTVIKKVISNEFDAGAVRSSSAEPYLPYGLRVIATSDPIPTGPVVASSHVSPTVVRAVQNALQTMKDNEASRAVLSKLDPDLQGGFVAASDADYGDIRRLFNEIPRTCGTGCHPDISF
ncbi:phosphate/phosphite/phosphonate ABC transporter substrate-binding protein [Desulfofustis limnaeus]|jgi:phosphonate transport system substrate-binding protein|nr:phosphate/phosphite/phosphonate ABC transporter substrate-binding protein [Desulfofustis limnaeus]MDX9897091.1 phosphate/phosphite/phosphonate ABC transporter substrate-binding protein [Desulfofustis sp.]